MWPGTSRRGPARTGRPRRRPNARTKVESMKKRYRSESTAGGGSRWPLFARLDRLVRCLAPTTALVMVDRPPTRPTPSSHLPEPKGGAVAGPDECEETKGKEYINQLHKEGHCNMQPYDPCDDKQKVKNKRRREEKESWEVMESIPWLAEVALRVEQARMEAIYEGGGEDVDSSTGKERRDGLEAN